MWEKSLSWDSYPRESSTGLLNIVFDSILEFLFLELKLVEAIADSPNPKVLSFVILCVFPKPMVIFDYWSEFSLNLRPGPMVE